MHVRADSLRDEVRVTVDAAVEVTNVIAFAEADTPRSELRTRVRSVLVDHEFVRAVDAEADEVDAVIDSLVPLTRLVTGLPGLDLSDAVSAVNAQLGAVAIAPSLSSHDGFALHIHWTPPTTPFAHQVAVDLLMAVAQTLCDDGTERFGRCAADGCDRVFHDTTKNRSRRFCADLRCASRTHTAAHRARTTTDRPRRPTR